MIRGLGIDLVDVEETRTQIETIPGYLEEVFTSQEVEDCKSRPNPYQCFAARFAAKEAFMKATGTGWTDEVDFKSISIESNGSSVPKIILDSDVRKTLLLPDCCKILVSMTHLDGYACAVVILEG
jgi:holo-[acyl-carrier protein] synthase